MSRNLLQMTGKIFDEFATRVSEEHKEYIVSVNRHISIWEQSLYHRRCSRGTGICRK